jgi:hypothetical protein
MEVEMNILLSGVAMAALFSWVPMWSSANAMTTQTHNKPGYNFSHPFADADNVSVRAEAKHDGMSAPVSAIGAACMSKSMPVIGAGRRVSVACVARQHRTFNLHFN